MKRTTWAVLAAAGLSFTVPAFAEDPPAPGPGADSVQGQTSEVQVVEVREGAGSMEPTESETAEERVEREFVSSVWNSP